jgi:prepilin-type N-terminal cleavage/methylation domain-containing protein
MAKHTDPRAGFTIVELVIVAVIIGLVAVIALPRIDITRYQINSGMRSLGSGMQAAQRRAISRQHDIVVFFDVNNQTVRVHEDQNNNGVVDAGELIRALSIGDKVALGRGNAPAHPIGAGPVTFTKEIDNIPVVTFHRNGAASEQGGVYLTSRRALNTGAHPEDTRLLEIERATGRISWHRYSGTAWEREF